MPPPNQSLEAGSLEVTTAITIARKNSKTNNIPIHFQASRADHL
jgi:hypothetical protein